MNTLKNFWGESSRSHQVDCQLQPPPLNGGVYMYSPLCSRCCWYLILHPVPPLHQHNVVHPLSARELDWDQILYTHSFPLLPFGVVSNYDLKKKNSKTITQCLLYIISVIYRHPADCGLNHMLKGRNPALCSRKREVFCSRM